MANTTNRNRKNGQFTYSSDFARLCRCGHSLGVHAGEGPHECFNGDQYIEGATGVECGCTKFRPARPHFDRDGNAIKMSVPK